MQVRRIIGQAALIGFVVACGTAAAAGDAAARSHASHGGSHHGGFAARGYGRHGGQGLSVAHYYGSGGLQCVPFARENTGIELAGNAANWWENAEGVYQRGARPEVGSVLNFRANGRMRMGHVAVVSNVIDPRNIEIDHANWSGHGGVGRNVNVVDVSANNDWSAVRVALAHTGEFGSVYPTYGFIYDRPDHGTMLANNGIAPASALNAPPRDLRPAAERDQALSSDDEEVAEAADDAEPEVRGVSSRHAWRHASFALRGAHGSRRFVSRSPRDSFEPRSAYGATRGHGPAHESFGRPSVVRAHELSTAHSKKRRT